MPACAGRQQADQFVTPPSGTHTLTHHDVVPAEEGHVGVCGQRIDEAGDLAHERVVERDHACNRESSGSNAKATLIEGSVSIQRN